MKNRLTFRKITIGFILLTWICIPFLYCLSQTVPGTWSRQFYLWGSGLGAYSSLLAAILGSYLLVTTRERKERLLGGLGPLSFVGWWISANTLLDLF
ncbi:MAG: hypothetical protein AABZ60_01620 [Planctomycetota bacterium]